MSQLLPTGNDTLSVEVNKSFFNESATDILSRSSHEPLRIQDGILKYDVVIEEVNGIRYFRRVYETVPFNDTQRAMSNIWEVRGLSWQTADCMIRFERMISVDPHNDQWSSPRVLIIPNDCSTHIEIACAPESYEPVARETTKGDGEIIIRALGPDEIVLFNELQKQPIY